MRDLQLFILEFLNPSTVMEQSEVKDPASGTGMEGVDDVGGGIESQGGCPEEDPLAGTL